MAMGRRELAERSMWVEEARRSAAWSDGVGPAARPTAPENLSRQRHAYGKCQEIVCRRAEHAGNILHRPCCHHDPLGPLMPEPPFDAARRGDHGSDARIGPSGNATSCCRDS